MSSAVIRGERASGAPGNEAPVAPPPKLRRRPAVIGSAVVAIGLGAVVTAWAWSATTHTQEVLAAKTTIARGEVIEADDMTRVRVSADPALSPVPGSQLESLVGRRAALDIAEGTLLTAESTTSTTLPPAGQSIVGVSLTAAQAPGVALEAGDRVRVVVTPPPGADSSSGAPVSSDAEVVGLRVDAQSGDTVVDLLVAHEDASVLAARVATGNVALVLDSRER